MGSIKITRSAVSVRLGALRALLAASAATCLCPMAGHAQEAQPAPPASPANAATGVGNDIVVTAAKREQTLQSVPVAVSVTSAETIQLAQIRDIKDLSSVVPSLRVSEHQSSAQTDFLIRGFGNGANNAGIEPSVGVFIDGVYRSRSAAQIADLPDLSRVEVLRGPQSTLFGKNASAGVVSIVTKEPQFTTGGSTEISYGNYNAFIVKSTITGKLGENWAGSFSSGLNLRDGIVHDAGTGGDTNNRQRAFFRGQLLYKGDNGLKVRMIADYGKIDERCCATVNLLASTATGALQLAGGKVNPANDPFGNVYNNFASTNVIENYGGSVQVDYPLGPLKLTSISALRHSNAVTNQDSDFSSLDLLQRNAQDLGIDTFTQDFRVATDMPGPINFLLGGYYFNEAINQTNQVQWGSQARPYFNLLVQGETAGALALYGAGPTPVPLEATLGAPAGSFFGAGQGTDERYRQKNEAISVFGQFDYHVASRLTFTGGVNYTHDTKNYSAKVTSTDAFAAVNLDAPAYAPFRQQLLYKGALAAQVGSALVLGRSATAAEIGAFAVAPATAAAFAAINAGSLAYATANMNNAAANPLAPLRAIQIFTPFLGVPNAVEPARTSDGNVSWTARLAFDVTNHINLYASYATGFKASSINLSRDSKPALADLAAVGVAGLSVTNLQSGSRFAGPEKSTVYEAGLKADWGIATVNFAAFKQIIKGFQGNTFSGVGFVLTNAGQESVYGFEFEGSVHPTRELTLSTAVTYLVPKYDQYLKSPFGDVSGATVAGIAPLSSTMAAQWDHKLDNDDHLIVRGDWHYESPTQIEDGLLNFATPAAGLAAARAFRREVSEMDASATYRFHQGLELSIWSRNLTDNRYMTVIFDSPAQPGSVSGYPNQPRTFGVSGLYRF